MARRLRRRLTFANVCSFLALTVALGTGGAYAANTVGSDDIIDDSIQSADIKNAQVKNPDLGADAVATGKIKDGDVQNADLADAAVTSTKIGDGAVTNFKLGSG